MRVLRLIGGLLCAAALVYAAGIAGRGDLEHAYIIDAIEKDARPARRAHAELLCQCLKVHNGKHLRIQITHQPDRQFCRAVCYYDDGGTVTKGAL